MRKTITAAVFIFLLFNTIRADAIQKLDVKPQKQQQTTTLPETYKVKLPDLKVQLRLIIGQHNYPDAGMCDTINGEYTVTNIGDAPSGEYYVRIEYKDALHSNWHNFGGYNQPSLMPGQSTTGHTSIQLRRCPEDKRHGFRVTVDAKNKVLETNENNNTAKKLHPSIKIEKTPYKTKKRY